MKSIFFILFIWLTLASHSQNYNTKIENANKVQVEKGVINITRANNVVIAKVIIQDAPKSRILLNSIAQKQDSSNQYITTIQFVNPDQTKSTDINLQIKCGTPIISAKWSFASNSGMTISYGITESIDTEKGEIGYINRELSAGTSLILTITSLSKIVPIIKGVDGEVK